MTIQFHYGQNIQPHSHPSESKFLLIVSPAVTMPRNVAREVIDDLWQKVYIDKVIPYSREPETQGQVQDEDLSRFSITREPFDIENELMSPPFLFKPLELSVLCEHLPSADYIAGIGFLDYATHTSPEFQSRYFCVSGMAERTACTLVTAWAEQARNKIIQAPGGFIPMRMR